MRDPVLKPVKTPVAIILYRRPRLVGELVRILQTHRPERVWLIADGPKGENRVEAGLCLEARREAERGITWDCKVHKIYAEKNLGLRRNVEQGLDALFAEESEAIILEEDCHPSPGFFPFCEEMLGRYRNETSVAGVSGNCFLPKSTVVDSDYFFSSYLHIWGWATWARAWNSYDRPSWFWPEGGYRSYFPEAGKAQSRYWDRIYGRVSSGQIQTWDYPWVSHLWRRGWVSITPSQNLVTNRGFGLEATNTRDSSAEVGLEREGQLSPPYRGPTGQIRADTTLDQLVFQNHFLRMEGRLPFFSRMLRSIRKRLNVA